MDNLLRMRNAIPFFVILISGHLSFCQSTDKKENFIEKFPLGDCFYRENSPDVYEDTTVVIVTKPAYEKTVVIPAEFETQTESVIVEQAKVVWIEGQRVEIPAQYQEVITRVLKQEEKTEVITVPAETTTVTKRVLVKKGELVWKKIACGFQNEGNSIFSDARTIEQEISLAKFNILKLDSEKSEELARMNKLIEYLELVKANKKRVLEIMVDDYTETYEDDIVLPAEDGVFLDYLPNKIGETQILFESTKDGTDSNQKVRKVVVDGFVEGLRKAIDEFKKQGFGNIRTITISSTTNGVHGSKSNHKRKLALDINKINGVRIMTYGDSKFLQQNWEFLKHSSSAQVKSGDRAFWKKVDLLQKCFNSCPRIRESFSPSYIVKYNRLNNKWMKPWTEDQEVELIKQHRNHLHSSFF